MSSYVVNQLRQEEAGKSKGNENKKSEGFPGDSDGKETDCNAGKLGSISVPLGSLAQSQCRGTSP